MLKPGNRSSAARISAAKPLPTSAAAVDAKAKISRKPWATKGVKWILLLVKKPRMMKPMPQVSVMKIVGELKGGKAYRIMHPQSIKIPKAMDSCWRIRCLNFDFSSWNLFKAYNPLIQNNMLGTIVYQLN
ncbi:hypothetical protein [Oligoflexus sp.]|uniref:hypothetical protein n=1 Tax=Oligoflexus sp. TaxID=1971216 RepID=UPI002D768F73|nr:hypothetical protein [Oligoflexus sp.]